MLHWVRPKWYCMRVWVWEFLLECSGSLKGVKWVTIVPHVVNTRNLGLIMTSWISLSYLWLFRPFQNCSHFQLSTNSISWLPITQKHLIVPFILLWSCDSILILVNKLMLIFFNIYRMILTCPILSLLPFIFAVLKILALLLGQPLLNPSYRIRIWLPTPYVLYFCHQFSLGSTG